MPIIDLSTFKTLYQQPAAQSRLLGLDLGSQTLGLALSDTGWYIASPFKTLKRTKLAQDSAALKLIYQEFNIAGLVCGLPLNMNGTAGPRVQATRDYALALIGLADIPLIFWDERLTTAMATRTLLNANVSRKRRAEVIDKMAAALILQSFLDCWHYQKSERLSTDPI